MAVSGRFELIDDVEIIITPEVSVVFKKGERFRGGLVEKGTALCIGLNSGDLFGMKVEGSTFLTVIVPNDKVKEIESHSTIFGG